MKKHFLTAAAVLLSIYSYGQSKGTSTISLGFSSSTNEYKNEFYDTSQASKSKNTQLRIGYGLFVSDNNKLGVDLLYNKANSTYTPGGEVREEKGYGLGINYQHYFPIVKTFYAFAGGSGEYSQTKGNTNSTNYTERDIKNYYASLAATGGLTWFISKRWALETSLISVGASYSKFEDFQTSNGQSYYNKTKSFSLSTAQTFNNLGFKVYLMF
jgi:hypothetical protein